MAQGARTVRKSRLPSARKAGARAPASEVVPVIGVGASAGGLEAFLELLQQLPPATGAAFVLIQHLDPTHSSLLAESLLNATSMPVLPIRNGQVPQADHVYVIPPGFDVTLSGDKLVLTTRDDASRPHLPVDLFFQSLAREQKTRAIGVVLSGTGGDGTEGLRAIKSEDGIGLVQDPRTTKYPEMPQSALDAGGVDGALVLPELAAELARLSRHPYISAGRGTPAESRDRETLRRICEVVRESVGLDFSEYKTATFERRLARRLALHRVETPEAYLKLLGEHPEEVRLLYEDVLIHVTSFFRDPAVFEVLKGKVFKELLAQKGPGEPIRLWVAGCSTGEEVYSLAICLLEALGEAGAKCPIQIFGSDVSERAIESARAGVYPESALRNVSAVRRSRWFARMERGYRISPRIRELCVFVRHDLARDPPFSQLDLVSCRNLLIYLGAELQQRVLTTLHYALTPPGVLVMGPSESIASANDLFVALDRRHGIFRRGLRAGTQRLAPMPPGGYAGRRNPQLGRAGQSAQERSRRIERALVSHYAPPGVVVNEALEVVEFRGRTGRFLETPAGQPQRSVLKMAREGVLAPLKAALNQAIRKKKPAHRRAFGVKDGSKGRREARPFEITVLPVPVRAGDDAEALYVVLFDETSQDVPPATRRRGRSSRVSAAETLLSASLEQELAGTREYLDTLAAEHGHANEELLSANEELSSGNEELQSMNEEIETAKEELQSANEELTTVNDELQQSNHELGRANSDLVNLLNTVDIPIIILDAAHRIRRFTPRARDVIHLLPSDIGRPLEDIRSNIDVASMDLLITDAFEAAETRVSEVRDRQGRWYRMQIKPYWSAGSGVDGAVISFVDIDLLKHHVYLAEQARDHAAAIVEAVGVPLVILDVSMRILSANAAFYRGFDVTPDAILQQQLFELDGGIWDIPDLRTGLSATVALGAPVGAIELRREIPRVGSRVVSLSARLVDSKPDPMIVLALEDVTQSREAEAVRVVLLRDAEEARDEAERANRSKDDFLATLSHELRTPLSTILMHAQLLIHKHAGDAAKVGRSAAIIERSAHTQARLIEDLLDISRIASGKLRMESKLVDLRGVVQSALESAASAAETRRIVLEATLPDRIGPVLGDATRLQQAIWNLLTNAVKFSERGAHVTLVLEHLNGSASLRVTDTGIGIDARFLPQVFDRFSQATSSNARVHGGLGLGLTIVRHIVEAHGGSVRAQSDGLGHGTTISLLLPVAQGAADEPNHPPVASATGHASPAEKALASVRVLLVDDDPSLRDVVAETLTEEGAQVSIAASGEEAIQALLETRPQVLISDIAMPGEDGYTFLRRLRNRPEDGAQALPAIALTALAGEEDTRRALAAGFQEHLAKPVDARRLTATVARLAARGPVAADSGEKP